MIVTCVRINSASKRYNKFRILNTYKKNQTRILMKMNFLSSMYVFLIFILIFSSAIIILVFPTELNILIFNHVKLIFEYLFILKITVSNLFIFNDRKLKKNFKKY